MKVKINNHTMHIPESWNALSFQQAFGIYQIAMKDVGSLFAPEEIMPAKRIQIARYLLKLNDEFMRKWEADCIKAYGDEGAKVFVAELDELCKITDPFFDITEKDDGSKHYSLKMEFTRIPFKTLMRKKKNEQKRTYYGPADELANLSLYELGTTFTLFERYLEDDNEAIVDQLIATLYRRPKPDTAENRRSGYQGDRRLPLLNHEATVEKRARWMATLTPAVKQMIVFWFACCRHQIIENHRDIFKEGSAPRKGRDFGWGGILLSLADGLVNLDKVSAQPWQNGLMYMRYLEDQRKQMEDRMKQVKRAS